MKAVFAIGLWSVAFGFAVLAGALWIVHRYDSEPECQTLASACAFETGDLARFGMNGMPLIWAAGVLLLVVVWGLRRWRASRMSK